MNEQVDELSPGPRPDVARRNQRRRDNVVLGIVCLATGIICLVVVLIGSNWV